MLKKVGDSHWICCLKEGLLMMKGAFDLCK